MYSVVEEDDTRYTYSHSRNTRSARKEINATRQVSSGILEENWHSGRDGVFKWQWRILVFDRQSKFKCYSLKNKQKNQNVHRNCNRKKNIIKFC